MPKKQEPYLPLRALTEDWIVSDHPHLQERTTQHDLLDEWPARLRKYFMGERVHQNRKFDDEAAARFLAMYALTGRKTDSAHASGVHLTTILHWQKYDESFGDLVEEAKGVWLDQLEREAFRRAVEGELEPVVAGKDPQIVTYIRRKSDRLLETLMRKADPTGYGNRRDDNISVNVNTGVLVAPTGQTLESTSLEIIDEDG